MTAASNVATQVKSLVRVRAYHAWLLRERDLYLAYKGDECPETKHAWTTHWRVRPNVKDQDYANARELLGVWDIRAA